jgi:prevent-host-death family protein
MDINLAEDITSISDFKVHINEVADKVEETKRPVVVTRKGKPAFAIVDIAEYERLRQASLAQELLLLTEIAEEAVAAGQAPTQDGLEQVLATRWEFSIASLDAPELVVWER